MSATWVWLVAHLFFEFLEFFLFLLAILFYLLLCLCTSILDTLRAVYAGSVDWIQVEYDDAHSRAIKSLEDIESSLISETQTFLHDLLCFSLCL